MLMSSIQPFHDRYLFENILLYNINIYNSYLSIKMLKSKFLPLGSGMICGCLDHLSRAEMTLCGRIGPYSFHLVSVDHMFWVLSSGMQSLGCPSPFPEKPKPHSEATFWCLHPPFQLSPGLSRFSPGSIACDMKMSSWAQTKMFCHTLFHPLPVVVSSRRNKPRHLHLVPNLDVLFSESIITMKVRPPPLKFRLPHL